MREGEGRIDDQIQGQRGGKGRGEERRNQLTSRGHTN